MLLTPLLLASVYPLFFLAQNLTNVTAADAALILASGVAVAGLCYFLPHRFRNVAALLFVLFAAFSWWALLAAPLFLLRPSRPADTAFFTLGLSLCALNAVLLCWGLLQPDTQNDSPLTQQILASYRAQGLPHVLYIVPDRYPSQQTLTRYYGFSNESFIGQLESMGFRLRNDSHANYTTTFPSLVSLLNMDHLAKVAPASRTSSHERHLIAPFRRNAVFDIFNGLGYETNFLGGAWDTLSRMDNATRNISRFMNYEPPLRLSLRMFLDRTPLRVPLRDWVWLDGPLEGSRALWCENSAYQANAVLETIGAADTPQMLFWHLYLPHPPYMHDETRKDCFFIPRAQNEAEEQKHFIGQLRYTNRSTS